jgi:hypothetical protein
MLNPLPTDQKCHKPLTVVLAEALPNPGIYNQFAFRGPVYLLDTPVWCILGLMLVLLMVGSSVLYILIKIFKQHLY